MTYGGLCIILGESPHSGLLTAEPLMTIKKKTVHIDKDEYDKFIERHLSYGAFTYWLNEALKQYNALNEVTPNELIKMAVGEITLKRERNETD